MLGEERLHAVGAEATPVHVGKQRLRRASCRLLEPLLQGDTRVPGQWCAPFLSSFTNAPHMSAGAEMDGVPVEADQLGKAQARLGCKQQQGVVAASKPCRPIGHGKYGLDLCARQEMHLPLGVTLARDREDALNKGTAGRFLERHETKKGADSGQAKVACPDAGAALLLEVFEKRVDERRVQIVEHQGRGRLAQPPLCKKEQQPERVPVGCDRVSADIALAHEPIGEVRALCGARSSDAGKAGFCSNIPQQSSSSPPLLSAEAKGQTMPSQSHTNHRESWGKRARSA